MEDCCVVSCIIGRSALTFVRMNFERQFNSGTLMTRNGKPMGGRALTTPEPPLRCHGRVRQAGAGAVRDVIMAVTPLGKVKSQRSTLRIELAGYSSSTVRSLCQASSEIKIELIETV